MTYYYPYRPQPPRRRNRLVWLLLGLGSIIATVVLVWWVQTSAPSVYVRDGDGVWRPRITQDFQPETTDTSSTRLLEERSAPNLGTKKFVMTQPDGTTPVTFDPCVPIEVEVNYWNAPPGGRELTEQALAEVETLTGLKFSILPDTDREVDFDRLYSGRRPVLISWTDRWEVPELGGEVLGVAGAQPAAHDDWFWFISGQVAMDGGDLNRESDALVRAVLLHELGHLVGLDHVDSVEELMFPIVTGTVGFGPGDISGLSQLGAGRCIS